MKRMLLLLLLFLLFFSLASCRKTVITIDRGEKPSYEIFASVPEDTEVIVLNTSSKKIHTPACRYAVSVSADKRLITEARAASFYESQGYNFCKICFQQENEK